MVPASNLNLALSVWYYFNSKLHSLKQERLMELTETVTATSEIFKGRVVHLRVDTVLLPDGSTSQREIVAHPGAVCMVPLNDAGEVLMVRQFRLAAGKAL